MGQSWSAGNMRRRLSMGRIAGPMPPVLVSEYQNQRGDWAKELGRK
jgi:hypothetical protein